MKRQSTENFAPAPALLWWYLLPLARRYRRYFLEAIDSLIDAIAGAGVARVLFVRAFFILLVAIGRLRASGGALLSSLGSG